jgi:hypothetical protein
MQAGSDYEEAADKYDRLDRLVREAWSKDRPVVKNVITLLILALATAAPFLGLLAGHGSQVFVQLASVAVISALAGRQGSTAIQEESRDGLLGAASMFSMMAVVVVSGTAGGAGRRLIRDLMILSLLSAPTAAVYSLTGTPDRVRLILRVVGAALERARRYDEMENARAAHLRRT